MRIRWIAAVLAAGGLAMFTVVGVKQLSVETASAPAAACALPTRHPKLNLKMKDLGGKDVRLADYAGKVLLVDSRGS